MASRPLPPTGTKLFAYRRKPQRSRIEGIVVDDVSFAGGRALEVAGRRYASLSEAASSITGGRRNGWIWWRLPNGQFVGETAMAQSEEQSPS
jgi:hypothetical protein